MPDMKKLERWYDEASTVLDQQLDRKIDSGTLHTTCELLESMHRIEKMMDKERGGYSGGYMPFYPRYYGDMMSDGRSYGDWRSYGDGRSYGPEPGHGPDADHDARGRYSGNDSYGYGNGGMDPMTRR